MNYKCLNKTPQEVLTALGFEEAYDRGWHIILSPNRLKFDRYNNKTWVPRCRIHALFFQDQINIHFDAPNGDLKHKTFQRHIRVMRLIEKIKEIDMDENSSPTPIEAQTALKEPTPQVTEKQFTFAEMVSELLKGEKFTKLEWKNPVIYVHVTDGILQIHQATGSDNWAVSEADMLGLDYVVVE